MDFLSKHIINHKKLVVSIFVAAALICAVLMTFVSVNYNMVDYLPEDAQSTRALAIMDEEFDEAVPNARVMLNNVTLTEALEYKEQLKKIKGITDVMWLDDVIDLKEPIEMADTAVVENYYKDNTALISVSIMEGHEVAATNAIYQLIGEDNAVSGQAVNMATAQKLSASESLGAVAILVPLIFLILLLSTSSWIDPVLFLLTIGLSVLINMGSNVFFGEVSFMTQSISPILQMAVSLDYAIFLLHSFEDFRKQTDDKSEAMRLAMKRAFPAIFASAATTLFGFMALTFMKFRIGSDLGINLVKGIILSYVSVMIFLPALILICYKMIDKTRHRMLIPSFKGIGKRIQKLRIPCLLLALLLLVPSFLAQGSNSFIYGSGSISPNSRSGQDDIKINDKFGKSTAIVILVPKGDTANELLLCRELEKMDHITGVVSYATMVGATIPNDYLDKDITGQFYSENYARIVVYTDTAEEGEEAFQVVEAVQNKSHVYYETVYTCGQSVNLYDMKNVVTEDNNIVNLIAVIAIALVLLFTFRSLSIPLILLFTIEMAIWINLSVPYFYGNSLCYIGFLVINTVQLGATVDYAILITENYRRNRKQMTKKEAINTTLGENFISVLVSATILSSAGFCLAYTSSNPIVAELGMLLGRGTMLSMSLVVLVLPAMLLLFDKIIEKTTLKADFYKGDR
jgi:uncharacterized protein